jgi:MoaA/NifB/PqqE/SkfB family radical SAM enzyme
MKKIIDHMHYLGVRFVAFMGGEPTIRKDFIDLVSYTSHKRMMTHLSTNGTCLTREYIKKLGQAGIDIINVSVDSLFEFSTSKKDCTHSKQAVRDLIDLRDTYNYEINVNIVLTRMNYGAVVKTLKHLNTFKIPVSIGIINGNTYDSTEMDSSLYFVTPEQNRIANETLDQIILLKSQGYNIIEPVQYFIDAKKHLSGNHTWDCGALRHFFSVDCDGRFQVCAGVKAEPIDFLSIDRNYYERYQELLENRKKRCNQKCFGNCYYISTHYIRRPLSLVKEIF